MRSTLAVGLLAVLAVALIIPSPAEATRSRIEALNIQSDYVIDQVNVHTYPSALFRHQNAIYTEFGTISPSSSGIVGGSFEDNQENPAIDEADRSLGVHFGNFWDGRIGVFGIYLNENATPLTSVLGGEYINRNKNESWNILWAQQWGGTTLGLELNRTYSQITDKQFGDDDTIEPYTGPQANLGGGGVANGRQFFNQIMSWVGSDDWNSLGFGAGVSFDWESDGYDNFIDLSGELRTMDFKFEDGDTTSTPPDLFESDNGISFSLNGRAMLQTADNLWWVPVVNFSRIDMGWAATPSGGQTVMNENDISFMNLGIAGNWQLRDSDLLVGGVAFERVQVDFQDFDFVGGSVRSAGQDSAQKYTYTRIGTVFLAYEGNVFRWLTFRAGARKPIYSTLEDENFNGEKAEAKDSPFEFSVGTGFHFGNFHVDAVVQQEWMFTGGPIAGDNETIPFTRLSGTYRF